MNLITDGPKIVINVLSELARTNAYLAETKVLIQHQNMTLDRMLALLEKHDD